MKVGQYFLEISLKINKWCGKESERQTQDCTDAVTLCGKARGHASIQVVSEGGGAGCLPSCRFPTCSIGKVERTLASLPPSTCSKLFPGSSGDSTFIWVVGHQTCLRHLGDWGEQDCSWVRSEAGRIILFVVKHHPDGMGLFPGLQLFTWYLLFWRFLLRRLDSVFTNCRLLHLLPFPLTFILLCPVGCLSELGMPVSYKTSGPTVTWMWFVIDPPHPQTHAQVWSLKCSINGTEWKLHWQWCLGVGL